MHPPLKLDVVTNPEVWPAAYDRCDRRWASHLGQETAHSWGTAIVNTRLANHALANQVRDFAVIEHSAFEDAWLLVEAHFHSAGTELKRITLATGTSATQRHFIARQLTARGFYLANEPILALPKRIDRTGLARGELSVIPGRAAPEWYDLLCDELGEQTGTPQAVEAAHLHLDDAAWEPFIVLSKGSPLAIAGLLTAGDAGMIEAVYVRPDGQGQGAASRAISHVLDHAVRSALRYVVTRPMDTCPIRRRWIGSFGFTEVASKVIFLR